MKNKIKAIMIQNGLKGTIRELAEIMKISEPSVNNKLSGREAFKLIEIKRFAKRFNLTDEQICNIFIRE